MRFTLTKRCEYGVRMLVYLAGLGAGARVTTTTMATECGVPAGNVPTVVNMLSRAGVLLCTPGRNGGCSLSRPAADITVLDVVQAIEGNLDADHCLLDSRRCHDVDPHCALHEQWSQGKTQALMALEGLSLADVVAREREIQAEQARLGKLDKEADVAEA